jgi:hypothetical protein
MERKPGLVDMMVRNQMGVVEYRFWGARTINDAYGDPTGSLVGGAGPERMFEVASSAQFRSQNLLRRRWSWYGENLKGAARVAWDPKDYVTDPATNFPGDDETWFVRVQERRRTVGVSAATGVVDLNAIVGLGDDLTIAGVLFTGTVGAGVPANQQFQADGGGAVAATALIATVNDGASQALLLAAAPAGVTVTASAGATVDEVILTASVTDASGNLITLVPATANIVVSGATLSGGGDSFLSVNGPVDIGLPKLGSIYVVPPPIFFGQPQPGITLQGTAPGGTGCVVGSVPVFHPDMQAPNPLHIVLPRWTATCFVNNLSGADTLLASTGWGDVMTSAGPTEDALEWGGGIKELVLAGEGATAPPFSIYAIVALGPGG